MTSMASATTKPPKAAVAQGVNPSVLSSLPPFGNTPSDTPETVSFVLDAHNLTGLKANVSAGMPGGFLSVKQFADRYGQSTSNIKALEHYLAGFGIAATADASRLDVNATGTAGEFDSALSVQQHQYKVPATKARNGNAGRKAMTIHGTADTPLLPRQLSKFVLSVLGLTNYPTFASDAVRTPAAKKPAAEQDGTLLPADFAKQYNVSPLYKHANGAGSTIGIVTLASLNPADAYYYWANVAGLKVSQNRISLDNVDGGSGPVSDDAGSGETSLDVEQSGGLAPGAKIIVYQAPNTDAGFVDGFLTAASQNKADSVSASWGESETIVKGAVNDGVEDPNYLVSFDEAYLELAAQGQSTFVSAGDQGAYDASADEGSTNLTVDTPGSSPWVTVAGGTTLPGTIPLTDTDAATIPAERAWGWDWLWPHWADFTGFTSESDFAFQEPAGGGGGFSADFSTPSWQARIPNLHHYNAAEYLTPTDFVSADGMNLPTGWDFNPTPKVTSGWGTGRAVPDVSADADPFTGYLLYFAEANTGGALQAGWGGTSFVAPQFNGTTALMDSVLGHRVGLWNPSVYGFALTHNSPFTTLTSASANNTNLFYTGSAHQLYNPATGLGTADFTKLTSDFASQHRR
ncbi:MAG TPA: S53 family peptidase [Micromonosporaceae bacterium]